MGIGAGRAPLWWEIGRGEGGVTGRAGRRVEHLRHQMGEGRGSGTPEEWEDSDAAVPRRRAAVEEHRAEGIGPRLETMGWWKR
jgi:hypothetical protein